MAISMYKILESEVDKMSIEQLKLLSFEQILARLNEAPENWIGWDKDRLLSLLSWRKKTIKKQKTVKLYN